MNKVILGLILAVCVLGLALVMLNDRLGRKTDASGQQATAEERPNNIPPIPELETKPGPQAEATVAQPARSPEEIEKALRAYETNEAATALAPPVRKEEAPMREERPSPAVAQSIPEKPASVEAVRQKPEPRPEAVAKSQPRPEPKPEIKPEPKPEARAEAKPDPKVVPKAVDEPKQAKDGEKSVSSFVIFSREKGATIRIGANQRINYKSMVLENPDRVVLDMDGDWKFPANQGIPKNDLVNNIRIAKNGDKTRVVIDLKEKPTTTRFVPGQNGNRVDVRIDK